MRILPVTRGFKQMAIKQKFVSDADRFLAKFNQEHALSDSQKAEIARSQKIFEKRNPEGRKP